jgi:arsenite oxidase small subunit
MADRGRRFFLSRGAFVAAAGAAAAATGGAPAQAAVGAALVNYPSQRLANVKDLKVNTPVKVAYPDKDSPGVVIKLGKPVPGGAGPDGDVVAFSTLCPHKGFPLAYNGEDRTFNCPGHYSRFDVEQGGLEVFGHATQNLAQFQLRIDAKGDIFAEGVDELIYGRLSNVLA